jgi:hypothetical protein
MIDDAPRNETRTVIYLLLAGVLLLCGVSYLMVTRYWSRTRARHGFDVANALASPLTDNAKVFLEDFDDYAVKQNNFQEKWLKKYDRYDIDTHEGLLILTQGNARIAFDLQSLGSVCKSDSTWQWAWANPNVPERMSHAITKLKAVGSQYGLKYLEEGTLPILNASTPQWLSTIALKVTQLDGVFVAQSVDMEYYFLVSNPRELRLDDAESAERRFSELKRNPN